jgi:tight adherence protein B
MLAAARAAAAGARLSARLVAALPLLFLPLVPLARAPLLDAAGAVTGGAGILLAIAGIVSIERLLPRPPSNDEPGAALAERVGAALRSGMPTATALELVARHPPPGLWRPMLRARRRAALGEPWPRALARSDDEALEAMARVLARAWRTGLPAADALFALADARRAEAGRAFDGAVRRAPVLMVIPLVAFVLPSFVLLALAPFLRSMSWGT